MDSPHHFGGVGANNVGRNAEGQVRKVNENFHIMTFQIVLFRKYTSMFSSKNMKSSTGNQNGKIEIQGK